MTKLPGQALGSLVDAISAEDRRAVLAELAGHVAALRTRIPSPDGQIGNLAHVDESTGAVTVGRGWWTRLLRSAGPGGTTRVTRRLFWRARSERWRRPRHSSGIDSWYVVLRCAWTLPFSNSRLCLGVAKIVISNSAMSHLPPSSYPRLQHPSAPFLSKPSISDPLPPRLDHRLPPSAALVSAR